jgi:hypothetical protein
MRRKLLPLFLLALSAPAWGAYAYGYHPTLSYTMVSGPSDLLNYTVYVQLSGTAFKSYVNGGHIRNSTTFNGQTVPADFQFDTSSACNGSLGSTRPYFEVESWDQVTGIINAHVGPMTLSHTTSWQPYVCYGDVGVTTYQGGTQGQAWDPSFVFISHLASATSPIDSTSNSASLSNTGATNSSSGMIDGAASFIGSWSYYIQDASASDATNVTGYPITVEAWVNKSGSANSDAVVSKGYYNTGGQYGLLTFGNKVTFSTNADSGYQYLTGAATLSYGTWYYLAGTQNFTNKYVYINGVNAGTNAFPQNMSLSAQTTHFSINAGSLAAGYSDGMQGLIDEVRVSNVQRSADWLLTTYRNIASVGTYWALGSESGGGATNVTLTPIIM